MRTGPPLRPFAPADHRHACPSPLPCSCARPPPPTPTFSPPCTPPAGRRRIAACCPPPFSIAKSAPNAPCTGEIAAVDAALNPASEDAPRTAAGFVCVERQPDSPWGVLLDNLHALPAHQGIGVGKTLMEAAQRWARGQGESQLYLYVLDGNTPAIAFYERQGWEYSGAEPDQMGGVDITALRYVYRLDARE
jgi:GNAT superfamily N-acetyltransferase